MSKSIHENTTMLKGLSKNEIDNQFHDPDSVLSKIALKRKLKRNVKIKRKIDKHMNSEEE